MSFIDNLETFQKQLNRAGYTPQREPFDISILVKEDVVVDCEIIAKKDFYNILYVEVQSNWRGIATDVAKKNQNPCLVITKYRDSHIILSTMKDHITLHAKPRHIVIDVHSKTHSMNDFIKLIKLNPDDIIVDIDEKIQNAFDKFSEYKEALVEFADNLDTIIKNTKLMIEDAISKNPKYQIEAKKFLKMCQKVINDKMIMKDIQDMLLQHILTYNIFTMIYDEYNLHQNNTIAKSLESLKSLLDITYEVIDYKTIAIIAESITDIDQRQEFLKKIYEIFYKKYDPDKADKDGIVYTPTEVVNFMVTSTDQLLKKHFKKSISDDNVMILDPATGTGTFLVYILRQISPDKLEQKYMKEIHANEISVLPYYIATLNIENTYKEILGKHKEFGNICWMDTLDIGIKDYEKLTSWFGNDDNVKRITKQQKSKIHVIIGNPPYNATQTSFNDANTSDKYPHIDKKIQNDYNKYSTTQSKNKSFDMYKRFLKWSSERIQGNGIIVFISNNSFLNAKTDDGIRKALYDEFDYIYTINLKGNTRSSNWRKEGGKIFGQGARVGIAISFFIKTNENHSEIQYAEIEDYKTRVEKLNWLSCNTISTLNFKKIIPDKNSIWVNQTENDFENLVPIISKKSNEHIFEFSATGISTNRDDWVYDFNIENLKKKITYLINFYNNMLIDYKNGKINIYDEGSKTRLESKNEKFYYKIKQTRKLLKSIKMKKIIKISKNYHNILYRPFVKKYLYFDNIIIESPGRSLNQFINNQKNFVIGFSNPKTNNVFNVLGTDLPTSLDLLGGTQNIPLWKYDNNKMNSNITKYGLELFINYYNDDTITAIKIFYYVYAILNDPKYRQKYKYNLERSLPRIPLAKNFKIYSDIGEKLFQLHCNFDSVNVKEYGLKRIEKSTKTNVPKLLFKKSTINNNHTNVNVNSSYIIIDEKTILKNIPDEVLEYKLGSKNPLQWILEFYTEQKNRINESSSNDIQIRKKFKTYKFDNYKEEIIILLNRVTTICVETIKLYRELEKLEWGPQPKLTFSKISKNTEKKIKTVSTKKNKKYPSKNQNDTIIDIYTAAQK